MRGRAPHPSMVPQRVRAEKGVGPFFPPGLRHFSALAVSPSLSVALRLAGRWGPRNPIKPALGSLRSSENWQQRGIREFFNSLLRNLWSEVAPNGVAAVAARIVPRKRPAGFRPKAYAEISTTKSARRRSMAQTKPGRTEPGDWIRYSALVERLSGLHCDVREENH